MVWWSLVEWLGAMNSESEALELQRLADGELDRSQIRRLLHQAESDPGLYRRIALTLVEDQIWRREICAAEPGTAETPTMARPGRLTLADDGAAPRSWRVSGTSWLAVAAGLLVMTWMGYAIGRRGEGLRSAGNAALPVAASAVPGNLPRTTDPASLSSYAPWQMQLVSNDGQPLGPESLPVLPLSMARELGLEYQPVEIPEPLQRQVGRHGYRVEPRYQYIHGRTSDGRRLVVPIQEVRLSPWGQ